MERSGIKNPKVLFLLFIFFLSACAPRYTPEPIIYTYPDFNYKIIDGEVEIFKYTGESAEVIIPEEINLMPVTSIGYFAFRGNDEIKSVIIPDSVTTIGEAAFAYCDNLASVSLGNGVNHIGSSAFNRIAINKLTLPDSVSYIGDYAFYACRLNTVIIPDSVRYIGDKAFTGRITVIYKDKEYKSVIVKGIWSSEHYELPKEFYSAVNGVKPNFLFIGLLSPLLILLPLIYVKNKKRKREIMINSDIKKPIYLYGFMGSGKSYIGRKIASETGLDFIDLDEYITKREGMEITDIFKRHGEKYFRELEFNALNKINAKIVSLGGGALTNLKTAEYAKKNAVVIFINTPFDVCHERIKNDGELIRPNAAGKSKDELFALYKSRETHYKNIADYIINSEQEIIEIIGIIAGEKNDYI